MRMTTKRLLPVLVATAVLAGGVAGSANRNQERVWRAACWSGHGHGNVWYSGCTTQTQAHRAAVRHSEPREHSAVAVHVPADVRGGYPEIPKCPR